MTFYFRTNLLKENKSFITELEKYSPILQVILDDFFALFCLWWSSFNLSKNVKKSFSSNVECQTFLMLSYYSRSIQYDCFKMWKKVPNYKRPRFIKCENYVSVYRVQSNLILCYAQKCVINHSDIMLRLPLLVAPRIELSEKTETDVGDRLIPAQWRCGV